MENMLIFTDNKCMICTLMKMLTFMDGPLTTFSNHPLCATSIP